MNTFINKKPVVAIDGTAGSGKGELAKKIAKILGFDHLDSGILGSLDLNLTWMITILLLADPASDTWKYVLDALEVQGMYCEK